jgi:hypothetical protein
LNIGASFTSVAQSRFEPRKRRHRGLKSEEPVEDILEQAFFLKLPQVKHDNLGQFLKSTYAAFTAEILSQEASESLQRAVDERRNAVERPAATKSLAAFHEKLAANNGAPI